MNNSPGLIYQKQKDEQFQKNLFQDQIQNIKPQQLEDSNNPNLIKIILICTYTQDVSYDYEQIVATKEKIICSESDQELYQSDDVVECNQQQECSKKEIIIYVERSFIEDSKLLKSNYIQKLDAIKLPICSANGIRIPNEYDLKQYFKFCGIKQEEELTNQLKLLDLKHLYGLLICSLIFQNSLIEDKVYESIIQQITLEVALKLLLIAVQYESKKQTYLYKLLKHLYYFSKGLIKESYDSLLQKITLGGMKPKQLQVEKPNTIKLITSHYIFKINSTILYPLFKQTDAQLFKFYKPLRENQVFRVSRNKDVIEGKDQLDYPHIYYLQNSDQETILVAYQQEFQGDILIFQEYQEQLIKYSDNYLGCIEYKNNGKEFILYDDGFPEYMENNFPQYVSRKKRKLLIIDYFSERRYDKPRQFTLKCLNLTNNILEEIITKEPQYNEQKYSFSLPLDHMAEVPSSRNFILIKKDEQVYTHGKINRHTFNLKINGLSIFQGFGISVVSICSKPYD